MFLKTRPSFLKYSPIFLALFVCLTCGTVKAQFSVAPSQTGTFFDDLRLKTSQVRNPSVDQSASGQGAVGTAGNYQYDQGQYNGQPVQERELSSPVETMDSYAREIGTPVGSGSAPTSYSRRLAGDLTGYNGPYPSTASFFAPT